MIRYVRIDTEILCIDVACIQYKSRVVIKGTGFPRKGARGNPLFCESKTLVLEKVTAVRSKLGLITLSAIISSIRFLKEGPLEGT